MKNIESGDKLSLKQRFGKWWGSNKVKVVTGLTIVGTVAHVVWTEKVKRKQYIEGYSLGMYDGNQFGLVSANPDIDGEGTAYAIEDGLGRPMSEQDFCDNMLEHKETIRACGELSYRTMRSIDKKKSLLKMKEVREALTKDIVLGD